MAPSVAIVGTTASGKSAVALAAALAVPVPLEIVSVDAMQVYRRMDIGTAKPSADEQALVRHHLIDVVEPWELWTVARFQTALADVRAGLAARGAGELLVGGTGLYQRSAVDGLDLPGEWPELRAELDHEAQVHGPQVLHARLATIDARAAARMEPTNTRRIVRALEVCVGSGRPFSSFGPGVDVYPATATVQVGLRWRRAAIAERIERRVRAMMAAGWRDEVAALAAEPRGLSRTARQALGYGELLDHLAGTCSAEQATDAIVTRTRQFAVRQERWFRRDPRIRWIDIDDDPVAEALPAVLEHLG
jgi:tRNA dimethylallyltransferase